MTTDTSGPAFPGLHPSADCHYQDGGMTMRNYLAAKAMQGYLSNSAWASYGTAEDLAKASYQAADAMLKEKDE